jgi:hypothetical protein
VLCFVSEKRTKKPKAFKTMAVRYHDIANVHKDEYETTPVPMDTVWEAEKLGLGHLIGYSMKATKQ